jgi:hypothetical protein
VAFPFTLKSKDLKAKEEELLKLKYFTMQKYILIFTKSSKRNQKILQDIITLLLLISSFNTSQKISCFKNKILIYIKTDLLLL